MLWDGAKKGSYPLAKAVCDKFDALFPVDLYDFLRSEQNACLPSSCATRRSHSNNDSSSQSIMRGHTPALFHSSPRCGRHSCRPSSTAAAAAAGRVPSDSSRGPPPRGRRAANGVRGVTPRGRCRSRRGCCRRRRRRGSRMRGRCPCRRGYCRGTRGRCRSPRGRCRSRRCRCRRTRSRCPR